MTYKHLAKYIDHTLLKPESTESEIVTLCEEAHRHEFIAVCVNPIWVATAASELAHSDVKIATVVGFPLGATTTFTKIAETRDAIANGANEIDMVINIGALKSGDEQTVYNDIKQVVRATDEEALVKVIIETSLLTDNEKRQACTLAKKAGADFVKTSTGFSSGGATLQDIALMREIVGKNMGIKASGGIRNATTADAMINAGATRIGASASISIVTGT